MEKFQLSKHFRFPWPVNVCPSLSLPASLSLSPSLNVLLDLWLKKSHFFGYVSVLAYDQNDI